MGKGKTWVGGDSLYWIDMIEVVGNRVERTCGIGPGSEYEEPSESREWKNGLGGR